MMKTLAKNLIASLLATLVIGLGVGFFAGTKYQATKRPSFQAGQFANNKMMQRDDKNDVMRQQINRPISGQITAKDPD